VIHRSCLDAERLFRRPKLQRWPRGPCSSIPIPSLLWIEPTPPGMGHPHSTPLRPLLDRTGSRSPLRRRVQPAYDSEQIHTLRHRHPGARPIRQPFGDSVRSAYGRLALLRPAILVNRGALSSVAPCGPGAPPAGGTVRRRKATVRATCCCLCIANKQAPQMRRLYGHCRLAKRNRSLHQ